MKIRVTGDDTVRTVWFEIADGPVLELRDYEPWRQTSRRFRCENGSVRVKGNEVKSVRVDGPMIKKNGSASQLVNEGAYWRLMPGDMSRMPAWLGQLVADAVRGVHGPAVEWEIPNPHSGE